MNWNPSPKANQEELAQYIAEQVSHLETFLQTDRPEILAEAKEALFHLIGDRSFDAYESQNRDRVVQQVQAVYMAIYAKSNVQYAIEPVGRFRVCPKIT